MARRFEMVNALLDEEDVAILRAVVEKRKPGKGDSAISVVVMELMRESDDWKRAASRINEETVLGKGDSDAKTP